MSIPSQTPRINKRPRTTEGATQRYLRHYEQYYPGTSIEDLHHLKDLAHAKIILLRKKAPKFYEEKLYNLINQAASALLACNVRLEEGAEKFHQTHKNFLRILDELGRCQPSGEPDFQVELDRLIEHDKLVAKHSQLSEEIREMEAREVNLDDLSDSDEGYKAYTAGYDELDKKKKELKDCSILLARIEGENIDDQVDFELVPLQGSVLERIEPTQIEFLSQQLKTMSEGSKNKRTAIYDQKPFIEKCIEKLDLCPEEFKAQDLKVLVQDIYDSYLEFYRKLEDEARADWHETMLKDEFLIPKEGIILQNPNDITPEMAAKLEESKAKRIRATSDLRAKFESESLSVEEEDRLAREIGDDLVSTDDEAEGESDAVLEEISKKKQLFARVKEEPRDDYDIFQSDSVEDFPEENNLKEEDGEECNQEIKQSNGESGYADDSVDGQSSPGTQELEPSALAIRNLTNILGPADGDDDDIDDFDESIKTNEDKTSQNNDSLSNGARTISSSSTQDNAPKLTHTGTRIVEEDEEDPTCLGLVAPVDKIECIEISDGE